MVDLKIENIDNYVLQVALFLTAISYGMQDKVLALIIFAVGGILKAGVSAYVRGGGWIQNTDNILLAVAEFLVTGLALAGYPMIALYVTIVAWVLKAVGSALVEGGTWEQNADNLILAGFNVAGLILTALGYPQYLYIASAGGAFFKAIFSSAVRVNGAPTGNATIPPAPTTSTTSTSPPAPAQS